MSQGCLKIKSHAANIDALRDRITRDLPAALGQANAGWFYRPLELLLRASLHRFAPLGARFDEWVEHQVFAEAARLALPWFIRDYTASGPSLQTRTRSVLRVKPVMV
jgi:hypothetical protein